MNTEAKCTRDMLDKWEEGKYNKPGVMPKELAEKNRLWNTKKPNKAESSF